jgi:hypothetical protein
MTIRNNEIRNNAPVSFLQGFRVFISIIINKRADLVSNKCKFSVFNFIHNKIFEEHFTELDNLSETSFKGSG